MKCFKLLSASLLALISGFFFFGCETEESHFTGLRLSGANCYVAAGESVELTAVFVKEDKENKSAEITWTLIKDTTGGASLTAVSPLSGQSVNLSNDQSVSLLSGQSATFTAGSTEGGLCGITVSYENYSVTAYIGVEETKISADDIPTGFAGLGADISKMTNSVTVTDPDDLITYAGKGNYLILVEGTIDMSRGMLPSPGSKSTDPTAALNEFVSANSDYSSYSAWLKGETKVSSDANTGTPSISNTYKNKIQVKVASNTAIIGSGNDAVIRGGTFSINKTGNVIIRNLTIRDAVDPFPHHEVKSDGVTSDGWNAQFDCIAVSGANHVWIDHCTFEDTLILGTAANGEKWQVYDGLCDITNTSSYVTVSNCIFRNHDKTSLIGNGESDIYGGQITLACNRFYGCGQRLPLLCYPEMHIYNNYYGDETGFYSNSYAIGARYAAFTVIAEGNYFGSGISNAFNASTNAGGECYASGNSTNSGSLSTTSSKPFEVPYSYMLLSYSEAKNYVKSHAGAGKLPVSK